MTRPQRFCRNLVFLSVFILLATHKAGHGSSWEKGGIFPEETSLIPTSEMLETCPVYKWELGECLHFSFPVIEESCEIINTHDISVYGGGKYKILQTLQSITYDTGDEGTYECEIDGLALFEMPEEETVRLVWYNAAENEYAFISDVKLYNTDKGKSILVILYCDEDKAPDECAQQLLLWTGSQWKNLEWDGSRQAIYESIPEDYTYRKSAPVDFANLTLTEYMAGPGDLECCPTGRIIFELELLDDKLSVKSHSFLTPVEETEEMRAVMEAEREASGE
jgi:hypothetical protein